MENKNILYMGQPSTTINVYNGAITAALSNDENAMNWVYNNYINIFCSSIDGSYYFDNSYWEQYVCPFMYNHMIPRELLKMWKISIKNLIIDSININSYLGFYVDKFYIRETPEYKKKHYTHGIFIYGYDIDKNIAYCCTSLNIGKFEYFTTDIEDIENAYWSINNTTVYTGKIHVLKRLYINDLGVDGYQLDPRVIKTNIENYIYSICTLKVISSSAMIFGYDSILRLQETVKNINEKYIDQRVFHLLWEHKTIMVKRLEKMNQLCLLSNAEYFHEYYAKIANEYLVLRNMVIKYNVNRNQINLKTIIQKLTDLSTDEYVILKDLVGNIRL